MDKGSLKTTLREATKNDLAACMIVRGKTRDNAISVAYLNVIGVTEESWSAMMDSGQIFGSVVTHNDAVVGFCYANVTTREILVLAVLADYDGQGIGKALLQEVSSRLFDMDSKPIWLATTAEPVFRAYGFYRHLGWRPTGRFDTHGDEILEFQKAWLAN